MSGKVIPPAPPCGEEEHQLCRPGRRALAGVEVFSKGGGWMFTSRVSQVEKRGVVSVAPPPAPLHQNPTRSHPSSRRRCHGAFVAARQVMQIKDPKICSCRWWAGLRHVPQTSANYRFAAVLPPPLPGSGSCDAGCVEPASSGPASRQPPAATTIF